MFEYVNYQPKEKYKNGLHPNHHGKISRLLRTERSSWTSYRNQTSGKAPVNCEMHEYCRWRMHTEPYSITFKTHISLNLLGMDFEDGF